MNKRRTISGALGLSTLALAMMAGVAVAGGGNAKEAKADTTAFTYVDTSISEIIDLPTAASYKDFHLSTSDYGGIMSYRPSDMDAKMAPLNTLNYIYLNGSTTAIGGVVTIAGKDPYINLFGKMEYSFTMNLGTLTKITIKAGCEFPSYAYLTGTSTTTGTIYRTTTDVIFSYDTSTSAWSRSYNHTALAASTFSVVVGANDSDGPEYNLVSSVPFFKSEWLLDHDTDLQKYLTINGESVASINARIDDSAWTYVDFPGSVGGAYAVPVRVYAGVSTNQIFTFHIHSKLFETVTKIESIGLKTGFAFPIDETNCYWLDNEVNINVLSAPTGVAVAPASNGYTVSFTGCTNATSYTLNVYDSTSALVASQAITNGGLITTKLAHATYTLKVVANQANATSIESTVSATFTPDDADRWATLFLADTAACDATGATKGITAEKWSEVKEAYARLHADYQALLTGGTSDVGGTTLQQALARYDYIMGKYKESDYATIFEHGVSRATARVDVPSLSEAIDDGHTLGVVLTFVVLALGAMSFFLMKKKSTR